MSGQDTSEEKSLPPSSKKLKDLRKKGQIAHSNDIVTALSTTGAMIFLWLSFRSFVSSFQESTQKVAQTGGLEFQDAVQRSITALWSNMGIYVTMLIVIIIGLVIVSNIVNNKGFLFSLETIKFDLNKLNPIEGFKRIFSLRSLVDLVKNILKILIFLGLCIFVLRASFSAPFQVPFCGVNCFTSVMALLLTPIIIIACVMMLFSGAVDVGLQSWLFRRQQRMTKTEAKRERKDQEGAPETRSVQRRRRQQILNENNTYSAEDATLFIEGDNEVAGIRFVPGETPLPIVVCSGRGSKADEILMYAYQNKKPIHIDEELASGLVRKIEIGSPLTEAFFEPFIRALKLTGQL